MINLIERIDNDWQAFSEEMCSICARTFDGKKRDPGNEVGHLTSEISVSYKALAKRRVGDTSFQLATPFGHDRLALTGDDLRSL